MKPIRLTEKQRAMVESSLHIVRWVISESISPNDRIPGLSYEDLYQEGCYHLCRAAGSFLPGRAKFETYAKKVVRNGLLSYCRSLLQEQSYYAGISLDECGDLVMYSALDFLEDEATLRIAAMETVDMLYSYARQYHGVTKLGIEALAKKVSGTPLSTIAKEYQVPVNHAGAWISRAVKKLRRDEAFLNDLL